MSQQKGVQHLGIMGRQPIKSKYMVLSWQQELYDKYLAFRKKSHSCAPSTEKTIHAAVFSFIDYMNKREMKSLSDVSAIDLKNWHINSEHSSARGRNLYASQLRIFFEHLSDNGLVAPTLSLALTCQCASRTSIVEVLSTEQLEKIEDYRCHALKPMELRAVAIVLLGLRMGIRSVDICKLKIPDISWKKQTISFIQQKTGVFVALPMPTEVGNSLYRYIIEGRPINQNSDQIFLSHMPPYHGLKGTVAIRRSIKHIFAKSGIDEPKGFHITRRTFASNMLRSGSNVSLIASALGHAGIQSVDPYLSTDEIRLGLCAIGCESIEYKGRYGL